MTTEHRTGRRGSALHHQAQSRRKRRRAMQERLPGHQALPLRREGSMEGDGRPATLEVQDGKEPTTEGDGRAAQEAGGRKATAHGVQPMGEDQMARDGPVLHPDSGVDPLCGGNALEGSPAAPEKDAVRLENRGEGPVLGASRGRDMHLHRAGAARWMLRLCREARRLKWKGKKRVILRLHPSSCL